MSCIAAPKIGIPDIPGLSLLLGDITIPTPGINVKLCCDFDLLSSIPIPIPLGSLLKTAMLAGGDAVMTVLALLDDAIETLNDGLDLLSFDCPLD